MRKIVPVCLALALLFVAPVLKAQDEAPAAYKGRTVASVIDELREQGTKFAYSTNLLKSDFVVITEPRSADPVELVSEILEPYRLTLRHDGELNTVVVDERAANAGETILLIVHDQHRGVAPKNVQVSTIPSAPRSSELAPGVFQFSGLAPGGYRVDVSAKGYSAKVRTVSVKANETVVVDLTLELEPEIIETITVSSSRYDLRNDLTHATFFADQRFIQTFPDLGDDPVRAAQRLPGTASSGVSARPYFRGGEQNETGLLLNGVKLFDPFHLHDFQNIFSVIDSRIVEAVEVYTGGYPVQYGNLMSGLVMLDTIDSLDSRHAEVGVSVFNTSVLAGMSFDSGRGQWLLSARRSNLDLIIEQENAVPAYHDIFAQASYDLTPNSVLSANLLFADDDVSVILANKVSDIERAQSDTSNSQFWLRLQNDWSEDLSSNTVLSRTTFSNARSGVIDDPERLIGNVEDRREFEQYELRQDWMWSRSERQLLQWGVDLSVATSGISYRSESEFFGLADAINGVTPRPDYDLDLAPKSTGVGVYVSDRFKIAKKTYLELGVRWDNQEYEDSEIISLSDSQFSPRASLFHTLSNDTEFRLSWGRYQQAQTINQLQVEDGVTEYFPAQRSDHLILGIRRPLSGKQSLRIEVFQKEMRGLRPRYENLLDPLRLLPEIEPDRVRVAPESAASRGFEVTLEGKSKQAFTWWASYSWSRVTDRIEGRDEKRNWDQTHAFHGGLNWSTEKWDAGIAAHLRSGWRSTELLLEQTVADPGYEIAVGPRNDVQLPIYATIDARISRRFAIGDTTLTAFFEVTNLANRDNVCCIEYDLQFDANDQPHLNRSSDYWFPLLPAIGVLWEF